MLGLALDCAGLQASAALWSDGPEDPLERGVERGGEVFSLIAFQALASGAGKADQLILVVEQLLETSLFSYQDLDIIAVNRGPGSFTGIRSAVALGRGLALATGLPAIGITTHEALAAGMGSDRGSTAAQEPSCLMIVEDARRGQVYCQSFGPDLQPLDDPGAEAPEDVARKLAHGRWRLAGSGGSLVLPWLDSTADVTLIEEVSLDARAVARSAADRLAAGEKPIAGFDLLPLYIRPPDAVRPKPLVTLAGQPALGVS